MFTQFLSNIASGLLLELFKKGNKSNSSEATLNRIIIDNTPEQEKLDSKIIVIPEYNDRIIKAIELLNINKETPILNAASIAMQLDIENISEVESVLKGEIVPTTSFLTKFSNKYEIDMNWLMTGEKDAPFYKHCVLQKYATGAIQIYEEYKPLSVYIFTADSNEHETAIAYKKDHYDFLIIHCNTNWRLSSNGLGGTGYGQLAALYETMLFLRNCHTFTHGRVVTEKEFENLTTGKCSINILEHRTNDYRWDDLLDLKQTPDQIERKKEYYGSDFIEAQEIIKTRINRSEN